MSTYWLVNKQTEELIVTVPSLPNRIHVPDIGLRIDVSSTGEIEPDSDLVVVPEVQMVSVNSSNVITSTTKLYSSENDRVEIWYEQEYAPVSNNMVNIERDRRIEAGFEFNGKMYDFDVKSKQRVTGAGALAKFAMIAGAEEGDYQWMGGNNNFSWISQDNSFVLMDANNCSAMADASALHEQSHVFAARLLKNVQPVPHDYKDDVYWP